MRVRVRVYCLGFRVSVRVKVLGLRVKCYGVGF